MALQHWFTQPGRFTYSLNVSEPGTAQALIDFLTKDRRGYCQQFAFAMAVLARLLDIPSRVAVGYTEGSPLGHDRWQVRTSDAHAWPELYFPGAGWLRFEPTPAGSGGQATAIQPAYSLPPVLAAPGGIPDRADAGRHDAADEGHDRRLRCAGQAGPPQRHGRQRRCQRRPYRVDLADRRGGDHPAAAHHAQPGQGGDPAAALVTGPG